MKTDHKKRIRKPFFEPLWELFYPARLCCVRCGEETRLSENCLCRDCAELLPLAPRTHTLAAADAVSAYAFDDAARELIHRFKYRNERYLAAFFAQGMALSLPPGLSFDAITPVPLHPKRKRERGYNQSLLLARELSVLLQIPLETRLLTRIRNTPTQTHLDASMRAENLRGAFVARLAGAKRILLVDDVLTTGHTLNYCAKALLDAGAAFVYALAAAA